MTKLIPTLKCHWCGKECGGTCLGLAKSTQMKPSDPAYKLLKDGHTTTPTVYDKNCYICTDPEFAQMGMPLCFGCKKCGAHIAADDGPVCEKCGYDHQEEESDAPH